MEFVYALVATGTVVLTDFLENLPDESDFRICFSQDRYIFHLLNYLWK
jgi:vesicle-associated membrane protein 7